MKPITFKPCASTLKQFESFCTKVAEELGKIKECKIVPLFCRVKAFGSSKKFVSAVVIEIGTKRFWLVQHKALGLSNVMITIHNVHTSLFGPGSRLHGLVSIEPCINTPERIAELIGDVFDRGISTRVYPIKKQKPKDEIVYSVKDGRKLIYRKGGYYPA